MQTILKTYRNASHSCTWIALPVVVALCVGASVANAAPTVKPPVIVSQTFPLFDLQAGRFTVTLSPAGGSFAVSKDGTIAVSAQYGNVIDVYDGTTGNVTAIPISNPSGASFDSQKNLFVGLLYRHRLFKLPYVNGSWVSTSNPDSAPACTGADTVACYLPNVAGGDFNRNLDFKNTAFDSAGNLYMVSAPASSDANAIYVLPAGSLYTGVPALVYRDDSIQGLIHVIDSIAFDPWGNLFFTDTFFVDLNSLKAWNSSLNVLSYSASTGGYAATKTVLVTYEIKNVSSYDNVMAGVAVDANGTVYYSDDFTGVFAIPNNPTTPADGANAYLVATRGAHQLMPDGQGNLHAVGFNGYTTGVRHIVLNKVVVPTAPVGSPSQATDVTTASSGVDCSGTVDFAFASGNGSTTASATTTGTCSKVSLAGAAGAAHSTTVTLRPGSIGANLAILTATDSASNTGAVTVIGEGMGIPQTITVVNPGAQSAAIPLTIAATATSGLPVTLLSTTTNVCTVSGVTVTFQGAGTCTIVASQSGDDTYAAAAAVTMSFTVNLTAQTITFPGIANQTMAAGSVTLAASASSGLPVSLTSTTTSVCTVSGTTVTLLALGSCTIEAAQAGNALYAAAPTVSHTFAIIVLPQAIAFDDPGAQRVGTPLTLSASATSGLPVTFSSTTPGVCTLSGAAVSFVAAGTCTIQVSQVGDGATYQPAPIVSRDITVNPSSWSFFTLGTPSITTLTVKAGETSSAVIINVASGDGAKGVVSFSCTDLPAGAACHFSPSAITLPDGSSTRLTISTSSGSASAGDHPMRQSSSPPFPLTAMTLVGVCLIGSDKRRLRIHALLSVAVIGIVMLSSCGGTSKPAQSTVTVHATKGAFEQTTAITLNIQK